MRDYDDPYAYEREEQRDAWEADAGGERQLLTAGGWIDIPSRAEAEADENPPPYRIEDDDYRGICGGCNQPVSASRSHRGGHEGSCLWKGGPWHPSCREKDRAQQSLM